MSVEELKLSVDLNRAKSLRDLAVESLREAIIGGVFQPGEHLRERELSHRLGMSTTPIKEAFRILGSEGLVTTIPRKGTYVSELVNGSIEEVLRLRAYVEGLCCRLMAKKASEEEILALGKQLDVMEGWVRAGNIELLEASNGKFHEMIRKASGNPLVSNILVHVVAFDQAFRKRALQTAREVDAGFEEHREVFRAIQDRDENRAESLMIQHILRTINHVLHERVSDIGRSDVL